MSFEFAIWLGIAGFVAATWIYTLSCLGHVRGSDETGFTFEPLVGRKIRLRWGQISPGAKRYGSFMPRLVLSLRDRSFLSFRGKLSVLLRSTDQDEQFLKFANSELTVSSGT